MLPAPAVTSKRISREGRQRAASLRGKSRRNVQAVYGCWRRTSNQRKPETKSKSAKSRVFQFLSSRKNSLGKNKKCDQKPYAEKRCEETRVLLDTKQPFDMERFCEALKQKKQASLMESYQQSLLGEISPEFQRVLSLKPPESERNKPCRVKGNSDERLQAIMQKYLGNSTTTGSKPDRTQSDGASPFCNTQNSPLQICKELPKPPVYKCPSYDWRRIRSARQEFQIQYSRYSQDEAKIAEEFYKELPKIQLPCCRSVQSIPCQCWGSAYGQIMKDCRKCPCPCKSKRTDENEVHGESPTNDMSIENDGGKRYVFKTMDVENYTVENNKEKKKTFLPHVCRKRTDQNGFHYSYNPLGKSCINLPLIETKENTWKPIEEPDEKINQEYHENSNQVYHTVEDQSSHETKDSDESRRSDENKTSSKPFDRAEYERKFFNINRKHHEENWRNLLDGEKHFDEINPPARNQVCFEKTRSRNQVCSEKTRYFEKYRHRKSVLEKYLKEHSNSKKLLKQLCQQTWDDPYDSCKGDNAIRTTCSDFQVKHDTGRIKKRTSQSHNHRVERKRITRRTASTDEIVTGINNYDSGGYDQKGSFQSNSTAESFAVIRMVETPCETNTRTKSNPITRSQYQINFNESFETNFRKKQYMTTQNLNDTNILTEESFVSAKSILPPSCLKRHTEHLDERTTEDFQRLLESTEDEYFDCPNRLEEKIFSNKSEMFNQYNSKGSKTSILEAEKIESQVVTDKNANGATTCRTDEITLEDDDDTDTSISAAKRKSLNAVKSILSKHSKASNGRDRSKLKVSFKESVTNSDNEMKCEEMFPAKKTSVEEQKNKDKSVKTSSTSRNNSENQIRSSNIIPRTKSMSNIAVEVNRHEMSTGRESPINQKLHEEPYVTAQTSTRSPGELRVSRRVHCEEYIPPKRSKSIKLQTSSIDWVRGDNKRGEEKMENNFEMRNLKSQSRTCQEKPSAVERIHSTKKGDDRDVDMQQAGSKPSTEQSSSTGESGSSYHSAWQAKSSHCLSKGENTSHDHKTNTNLKEIMLNVKSNNRPLCETEENEKLRHIVKVTEHREDRPKIGKRSNCQEHEKKAKRQKTKEKREKRHNNKDRRECNNYKEKTGGGLKKKEKREERNKTKDKKEECHKKEKRPECPRLNNRSMKSVNLKVKRKSYSSVDSWSDCTDDRSLCTVCEDEEMMKEHINTKQLELERSKSNKSASSLSKRQSFTGTNGSRNLYRSCSQECNQSTLRVSKARTFSGSKNSVRLSRGQSKTLTRRSTQNSRKETPTKGSSDVHITTKVYAKPNTIYIPVKDKSVVFSDAMSDPKTDDSGHERWSDTESRQSSKRNCARKNKRRHMQHSQDLRETDRTMRSIERIEESDAEYRQRREKHIRSTERIDRDTECKQRRERSCDGKNKPSRSEKHREMKSTGRNPSHREHKRDTKYHEKHFKEGRDGVSGGEKRQQKDGNTKMFSISVYSSLNESDELSDGVPFVSSDPTKHQDTETTECTTQSLHIPNIPAIPAYSRRITRYVDMESMEGQQNNEMDNRQMITQPTTNTVDRGKSCEAKHLKRGMSKKWYHFCFKN